MTQHTTILIVEDERIIARDLQQTLQELGYDAWGVASSAQEAITLASERIPDIVLMDIRLKGATDGIETAAVLRERFNVPIIFLTAHADAATLNRAKRVEPHGYLVKPVKTDELRSAIEVACYRHQMERRLQEREQWFSTTLNSIADAVIAVDLGGNVTFMNQAAELLTGTTAEKALHRPAREALRIIGEGDSPLERALRNGERVELSEAELMNLSTGTVHVVADSAAPVLDKSVHLGAVMVFRDITEQRRLRQQLELAERLASLGTMAAGVAHEINNPLTVVTGNVDYIAHELWDLQAEDKSTSAPSPHHQEQFRRIDAALVDIRSAAHRIASIVSELKAFSRPELLPTSHADVSRCIDWALRTTAREFKHRAKVVTEASPLPPVAIDETRLGQVLINLLMNAAQAIPPGNANANVVTVTAAATANAQILIEVRDTGSGIPRQDLAHIFDPFFTTKAVGVGTGLGLSICHGIVKAAGGHIEALSEEGRGTTMRVTLPVANTSKSPPASRPTNEQIVRGKLLIIDDEPAVLNVLARILRNHDVRAVADAQAALDLLDAGERFDLILTDLMMPTMSGMAFYEKVLVSHPEFARRVAFLTGGPCGSKFEAFLRTVPNRSIAKPCDAPVLRETVQRLLRAQAEGAPA